MTQKFVVKFVRYDESGRPYDVREEGTFEMRDGKVWGVSGALDDLVEDSDTIEDVKRKLKAPYFRIEPA